MNIKDMSIEQLKALKCDHYESIAKSQQQLQVINQELLRRQLEENKKEELRIINQELLRKQLEENKKEK